MRMRKKKNLEERIAVCQDWLIEVDTSEKDLSKALLQKQLLNYEEIFGNSNKVELEIGCGKGQFIFEMAKRRPDTNFIAVEKTRNVIVHALEKAKKDNISNVRFICTGAEYLEKYLPEKSIELLYLNFSCPFQKDKYAKHRLTHRDFLAIYKTLLVDGARIYQKTDNMKFFEFSIGEFSYCNLLIENVSLDLHNSDFEGNIVTEYEKRFSDLGQVIYRLEASFRE